MSGAPERSVLHRAPWVMPVVAPPIADGGLVTTGGRIRAVGPFKALRRIWLGQVEEHADAILIPALINAHAHLELSHLAALGSEPAGFSPPGELTAWIRALVSRRERADEKNGRNGTARQALRALYEGGVALVADIGNDPESRSFRQEGGSEVMFFLELIGLSRAVAGKNMDWLATEAPRDWRCTAHAPYSASGELIRTLKQRAGRLGQVFPIHVAESREELRLLSDGTGPLRDFLEERGSWDGSFEPPGCGPVEYLDTLGALDERTLCVHGVHLSAAEMALVAARRAKVCLCPGSNRYLGVGKAPLPDLLARGLLPALGTDSLASNRELSLWREMAFLREDHPGVAPETVFRMATLGGARALGVADRLGGLAPLRAAAVLAVAHRAATALEAYEFLTGSKEPPRCSWIS